MKRKILSALLFTAVFSQSAKAEIFETRMLQDITAARPETYCREYTRTVTVGGVAQNAYGTACMQPDGSWQIRGMDQPEEAADVREVVHYDTRERPVLIPVYEPTIPRFYVRQPFIHIEWGPHFRHDRHWCDGHDHRHGHRGNYRSRHRTHRIHVR